MGLTSYRDILLTIAIPTYNRSGFLNRCLNSFLNQGNLENVEILVSNNASDDDTSLVIEKFKRSFPTFTIIENEENLGMGVNISQCFEKSRGKYVWVFGDDDFMLPIKLLPILNILQKNNLGILHLVPSYNIPNTVYNEADVALKNVIIFDNHYTFFNQFHYWATFITSNIVNKSLVKDKIDPFRFKNSYLPQLSWVLPALFEGEKNVIIHDQIIFCESDNTGGYKLYEVFGKNYNLIMDSLIKDGISIRIKSITNYHLLSSFFPMFIKLRSGKFEKENYIRILFPVFWKYKLFWKNIMWPYFKAFVKSNKP